MGNPRCIPTCLANSPCDTCALLVPNAAVQQQRAALPVFADVCYALATPTTWEAHAAAVAAQPSLAQDVAALSLTFVSVLAAALPLPPELRPQGCTREAASRACAVLHYGSTMLRDAVEAHLGSADGATVAAAIAAAAQLVHHVPLDREVLLQETISDGGLCTTCTPEEHVAWPSRLLTAVCRYPTVVHSLDSRQRERVAAHLFRVLGRLQAQLGFVAGRRDPMADPSECTEEDVLIAGNMAVTALIHCLSLLPPDEVLGQQQAAAWCRAVCDALRCMPLVEQLRCDDSLETTHMREMAASFSLGILSFSQAAAQAALKPHASAAAVDATLQAAVWQLHSRLAQLVHFVAAADSPLVRLGDEETAGELLYVLSQCVVAARKWQRMGGEQPQAVEGVR